MTAIVKIKHCIWRDGRPRFVPGPAPRKAGLKGKDLRHPSGQWFDLAETQQFSETICQQIKALRSGKSKQRRAPAAYTLSSMVVDGLDHAERQIVDGKRRRQALAPKTVHWYRQMFKVLLDDHSSIMHETQPKDLTFAVIANMLEAIEVKRGLATARGCRAVLSTCWQRIRVVKDLPNNPFRGLDMPAPAPRVRYGTVNEMKALIAAADAIGRPEIGDSVMLGLMTGQRQADRLQLLETRYVANEFTFWQAKTRAIVTVPATPQLTERMAGRRDRQMSWTVIDPHVILDEKNRRPFNQRHYGRIFAEVRKEAVKTVPSLADFRDQDLRDTAVTWLALADCEIHEICTITGHEFQSAHSILKHYLARHPDMARSAIGKLVKWLNGQKAQF